MCVDITDLNDACPNDPYPLTNIDRLVKGSLDYKMLSFVDAYSRYNQIKMDPTDAPRQHLCPIMETTITTPWILGLRTLAPLVRGS